MMEGRINLRMVRALCMDGNGQGLEILAQTLMGFGVERIIRSQSIEEATRILGRETIDLILCDALLNDGAAYEVVRWLRASDLKPNRFAPVIVVTGHTQQSMISQARDCGSNFVVAKPLAPAVLMQRLMWVARGSRPFVEAGKYIGPDRRFKYEGVPEGKGRRRDDITEALGAAKEPNMSQVEIDSLLKPQKVQL